MHRSFVFAARFAATALVVGMLVAPSAASAQNLPSYAQQPPYAPPVPSYARVSDEETLHGRIESIPGTFDLVLRDDRGFIDAVELHQGTVINPIGLTLVSGMNVTIVGRNAGARFAAIEVDAPYRYAGPPPERAYYGPGWWYPGYAYGYGPSFGLTFVFGSGYVQRPFYPYFPYHGYFRGAYATIPYRAVPYRAPLAGGPPGAFAGRTFASVPASRYPGASAGYRYPSSATGYATSGYRYPTAGRRDYTSARSSYAGRSSAPSSSGRGSGHRR